MPSYTRSDIIDRSRRLIAQVDTTNSNFLAAELNDFVDDWLIDMATWLEYPRAEATFDGGTVSGQLSYSIDKTLVLKILNVYRDKAPLIVTTEEFIKQLNPKWRDAASGTPEYAFLIDNDVLAVWPKDNTSAKELLLRYVRLPTLPTADSDTFDLPVPLQKTGQFYVAAMAEASRQEVERATWFLNIYRNTRQLLRAQSTIQIVKHGWEMGEGAEVEAS